MCFGFRATWSQRETTTLLYVEHSRRIYITHNEVSGHDEVLGPQKTHGAFSLDVSSVFHGEGRRGRSLSRVARCFALCAS